MADGSTIEWTDATWNPVTGCSVVSPGCTNCYAMRLAGTRLKQHPSRAGLTVDTKAGPVWTGQVRLNEAWLDQPLRWRRPRRIFVCAHGDLFHESAPDAWIDRVFAVMALAPQHTFQVLTKRAARMREYLLEVIEDGNLGINRFGAAALATGLCGPAGPRPSWPLPNVWLGVSVEDQTRADERIPLLLDTPAAIRFISAEPLLGPINLAPKDKIVELISPWYTKDAFDPTGSQPICDRATWLFPNVNWVIAGGESGPGARPMHPDWARSLRDQCRAAGVPFFFKQWGAWDWIEDRTFDEAAKAAGKRPFEHHSCGRTAVRKGNRLAGRLLDGREWNEFPA